MRIIDLENRYEKNESTNYIALGNFDGIHLGHKKIINKLLKFSNNDNVLSSILLFKNHTQNSLSNGKFKILISLEDKLELLENLGIDIVYLVDFNVIKNLEPEEFLKDFLYKKLNVRGIFVGYDYRFGIEAKGNTDLIKYFSTINDLYLHVENPVKYKLQTVSSTLIKELISADKLLDAEKLLGRKYFIKGKVVGGKKLGTKLGFPTANIKQCEEYSLPSPGVYIAEVIYNNESFMAATSIGKNYTFEELDEKIESHILDFNKQIYGEYIKIRFIKKIREMEKFSNIDDLVENVNNDINTVRNYNPLGQI